MKHLTPEYLLAAYKVTPQDMETPWIRTQVNAMEKTRIETNRKFKRFHGIDYWQWERDNIAKHLWSEPENIKERSDL